MNWARLRSFPWLDTRAAFVARTPRGGSLLDLGSSDGETLSHMAELRPDLRFFAADLEGKPENYPRGCTFHRGNFEKERLPWNDACMDAITCMHLVEHLQTLDPLLAEIARLLKPGGRVYFETPKPFTVHLPSLKNSPGGPFTFNFYDDPTHIRPVPVEDIARDARRFGLQVQRTGTSRNWLFTAAYPVYSFAAPGRKKFTSRVHWVGWSAYLIAARSA